MIEQKSAAKTTPTYQLSNSAENKHVAGIPIDGAFYE